MGLSDNLIANEQIVFESEKHWIAPLRDSLVPILLLLGAYFLGWLAPDSKSGIAGAFGNLLDLIRNGLLIVAVVWIGYNIIVWRTAKFAVTNLRVIREEGFISKRQSATLLANVTDVKTRVPFLGGPLHFGDLTIFTQSGNAGADRFTTITKPIDFRDKIMDKKMADAGSRRCDRRRPRRLLPPRPRPALRRSRPTPMRPRSPGSPSCATAARSRPRTTKPRRRRSSPGCSPDGAGR